MSAAFNVNQAQLDAVMQEFIKLQANIQTNVPSEAERYMNGVWDFAIDETHYITHSLQQGWHVVATRSGGSVSVKLINETEYAKEEFDRPGEKKGVGTPHDVRPAIQDFAMADIEQVLFKALTQGL